MTRRVVHGLGLALGGIAGLIALAFVALVVVSRTSWGMERARRFAESWLHDQVSGQVTLVRVTGDGLLGGATVHGLTIADSTGRPFAEVDSLTARYDVLNLMRGRIVIGPAIIFGAVVHVEKRPGDSRWNFERIFQRPGGDGGGDGAGTRRLIRFDDVRLADADVEVVRPFDGGPGGMAERYVIEPAEGGRIQVMRFTGLDARLSRVYWSRPGNGAREFRIETLAGLVQVVHDAFTVTDLDGTVIVQDSVVGLDVRSFQLPASQGSLSGRVINTQAGTIYDLNVRGEAVTLSDLEWVDARMPGTGEAGFDLRLATQADGSLLLSFRDIEVDAPGTRVSGSFGFVAAARPALRDVDLNLMPLDLSWAGHEFMDTVLVPGRLTGRVRAAGPLTAVRTSGDVRLTEWGGGGTPELNWSGTLRLEGPGAARGLSANVTGLDLTLLDRFNPGLGLRGTVDGRVDAEGPLAEGVQVRALIRHDLDGWVSELDGGGSIAWLDGGPDLDLRFNARPLRLEAIARRVPNLERLRGPAAGELRLAGTIDSLVIAGDVETDGGPVDFRALVDRRATEPRITASAGSPAFVPSRIGLVDDDLAVSGRSSVRFEGSRLENLTGPLIVALDSATIRGVPLERSRVVASLAGGRLAVDSAEIASPGLRMSAEGSFGLVAGQSDSLRLIIDAQNLEPLERILFDEVADPTLPRVSGSGRVVAGLSGSIAAFDATLEARIEQPFYDGRAASSAHVSAWANGVRTDSLSYALTVVADSVRALDGSADSIRIELTQAAGSGALDFFGWREGVASIRFTSTFDTIPDGSRWRVAQLGFQSGPGEWSLADTATVTIEGRSARIEALRMIPNFGGEVSATGTLAWAAADVPSSSSLGIDFDVQLDRVPFGLVPAAMRPAGDIRGTIDGSMHIAGLAGSPTLTATLDVTGVEYEGAGLERVQASFRYSELLLDAQLTAYLEGREVLSGSGAVPVDLRFGAAAKRLLDRPLDFTVRMDSFPAAFMFGFTSGFSSIAGVFDGSIEAQGSADAPDLRGALVLRDGAATWDATGVRYVGAEGTFLMSEALTASIDFTARTVDPRSRARSGTARVTGTLDLAKPSDPGFDLALQADRILAARRRDMEITASGSARIGGRYTRPEIGGDITIGPGTLYLDELYRQYLIVQLEDPLLFDVVDTTFDAGPRVLPESESPFLRNLLIRDMQISVSSGSWLQSREIYAEVAGDLAVLYDRQADDLRMSGTLNVIRGTYRLEYPPITRAFEVRQGIVDFPGTPGIDPNLNITAVYTARTAGEPLDIYADVTGTLQSPRVTLRSDAQPPISESDLASYLFFGAPTYAFNFSGSGSTGGGVFGNLGGQFLTNTGLGYFASGLQTLGQSFGLVDYVGLSAAETGPTGGGESGIGGLLTATKIELGRYITPRLFVTYTQRLNSPANAPGVRLEWRFHPTYTMELFAEDRFARAPSFGLSRAIAARRVLGFFLFREWGY